MRNSQFKVVKEGGYCSQLDMKSACVRVRELYFENILRFTLIQIIRSLWKSSTFIVLDSRLANMIDINWTKKWIIVGELGNINKYT